MRAEERRCHVVKKSRPPSRPQINCDLHSTKAGGCTEVERSERRWKKMGKKSEREKRRKSSVVQIAAQIALALKIVPQISAVLTLRCSSHTRKIIF